MPDSVITEIAALQRMSVDQLRDRWRELYGEESRSRNKPFLYRRLAWRLQELRYGGLSDRAKARLTELSPEFTRARTPTDLVSAPAVDAHVARSAPVRDMRLPTPGTVLTRQYRGREIRVVALDDGSFEWDERRYGSLSEVARAVTGARWNGRLFFRLTGRKRGA